MVLPKSAAKSPRTPTRPSPRCRGRGRRSASGGASGSVQPQRLNLEISCDDEAPPPSTLTHSTDATNAGVATTPRTTRRIEERDNQSLFQLANVPSPIQQRDHVKE